MRVFKTKAFDRFARRERITDDALREAAHRADHGEIDADLGGGVIKQRIARSGEGKSGGFRTIILFRRKGRAFFVYGFSKLTAPPSAETNSRPSVRSLASCWVSRTGTWRWWQGVERSRRSNDMDEQYASPALAAVHETALDRAEAGVLEKRTMKTFDAMCLTPVESLDPRQIKRIRLREGASQAVFARYLNVTPGLVSQWERGDRRPRGASLKLLTLVARKGLHAVA